MSRREEDVLERNVRALLQRAYVPERPDAEFRGALRREFLSRAAALAAPAAHPLHGTRRVWPRLLLGGGLAAAGIAVFAAIFAAIFSGLLERGDPHGLGELPSGGALPIAEAPEPRPDARAEELGGLDLEEPDRRAARAGSDSGSGERSDEPAPVDTDGSGGAPTGAVNVRVVDAETGAAVPAFTLWARPEAELPRVAFAEPAEGRAGEATATGLELGAHTLLVEAEGYAAWRTDGLVLEPGRVTELEARLDRGISVSGEVHDRSTGVPVAGALVIAELDGPQGALSLDPAAIEPPRAHAITDAAGRYTIPCLSRRAQRLRVLHPDFAATWTSELLPPAPDPAAEISLVAPAVDLSAGGSLEGWLEAEGGAPAVGAEVFVSMISMDRALPVLAYLRLVSDAEGRFLAEHLPPGFYVVVTQDLGTGAQVRQTTIEEGARSQVRFGAGLGRPSLRGVLVGPDGAPRPGYQIAVVPEGPEADAFEDWVVTLTDDEGRFVFETLDPGAYGVYADPDSSGMTRRDSVEIRAGEENELRVVLEGGVLAGRIEREAGAGSERKVHAMLILVRADPDRADPDRAIEPGETESGWVFHAKGDPRPDGSYRFDALPPGRYRVAFVGLAAHCGGYLSPAVELLDDETVDLPLAVRPGVQVQPVTRTATGEPLAGAVVLLFDETGEEFPYHPAPITDSAGRGPATSLRTGRWAVEASAPGYATVRRWIDLDPTNGPELEVPLVLEPR